MEIEVKKKTPREQWGEERVYVFCSAWAGFLTALGYVYFDARPGWELVVILLAINWFINHFTLAFFRDYDLALPFLLSEEGVPDDAPGSDGCSAVEGRSATGQPAVSQRLVDGQELEPSEGEAPAADSGGAESKPKQKKKRKEGA